MKETKCEWCGKVIGRNDIRVKLPMYNQSGSMTYCPDCYVRVYDRRTLRALTGDKYEYGDTVGKALRTLLDALDPVKDDDE